MDEIEFEYVNYWETNKFYQELDSWGMDGIFLSNESSSPEGTSTHTPPSTSINAKKNIIKEQNRRRMLNDKLYALRSLVPNITKMDKASIIKDAIECIHELQQQEKNILAEIDQLEVVSKAQKKQRFSVQKWNNMDTIEVTEIKVWKAEEKSMVISITCNKKKGTMAIIWQLIETVNLKIKSANITTVCGNLLYTLIVEVPNFLCFIFVSSPFIINNY